MRIRSILAALAVCFAGVGQAVPALADCALEIAKTRQRLEALPAYVSTKTKQDAANHLAWAEKALRIKSEADCFEHVKRAKELVAR